MASLPSPTQVAGSHYVIYETYFNQLEKEGNIQAVDAAKFLKKSGLPDGVLSKIWDLSDPNGKGFLNKAGLFVALKLISLAQAGQPFHIGSVAVDVPPPNMGPATQTAPPPAPTINSVPATISDWAMKPSERSKYEQLFDSLQPTNGVIPGNKVKGLLIDSKLPVATLGKIWDLADMDKDGSLDRHEFIVAMHLVYKALEKYAIPSSLPPELLPPNKRKESMPTGPTPAQTFTAAPPPAPVPAPVQPIWVVTQDEKAKYDQLFQLTDIDKDGFVSGPEIKDVFMQSGVPQNILARIWGLCDIKQSGKLNCEQFALAMWLIQQKIKGVEPPATLSSEMVPPSFRTKGANHENNNVPYSTNPELEMIAKDIEDLVRERQALEGEILQKQADIKIKMGEAKSLQGELDTLAATLKQLENQKGEAQKRLNDLKNQSSQVENDLKDVNILIDLEVDQVEKLRKQADEQEALVKAQEEELSSKKQELEELKAEEARLEKQQTSLVDKLESIGGTLQESQLTISQIRTKIIQIQENQRALKEAISVLETALADGDISSVSQTYLDIEPEFSDSSVTKLLTKKVAEEPQVINDIYAAQIEPPKKAVTTSSFMNDSFNNGNDPFASNDHFTAAFPPMNNSGFDNDPFRSFGSSQAKDPFDPFGASHPPQKSPQVLDDGQDPFGCEPFGAPAPALPPKNKQPPPRPAPPRPAAPPSNVTHTAPPASNDSFADFSNFNAKFDNLNSNMDFTEDPFSDYRYEDPFMISSFEDTSSFSASESDSTEKKISSELVEKLTFSEEIVQVGVQNSKVKVDGLPRDSNSLLF